MNSLKDWIISFIVSTIKTFDNNVNKSVGVLTEDIFKGDMYNMAKSISDIIIPIALTIITICFLIEFLKLTIKMDVLKWEYLLRVFFKFVFAKVCIDVSYSLLSTIYATASEWITKVGSSTSTLGNTIATTLESELKKLSAFEVLGVGISMLFVFIASWVISILIMVIAYARSFELLAMLSVSPLPCAFLPVEDGPSSRIPKKFFLSFAAVSLQGLFIIISIKLYSALCSNTILTNISSANITEIGYNLLLGALVLIMAVIKSGSWAKSILDAM